MKSLTDHLSTYASYHRDQRNIATHFVGIPMIVLSVLALLSRPSIGAHGLVSPALLVVLSSLAFYALLSPRFALLMAVLLAPALYAGREIAANNAMSWLVISLTLFFVGWVVQFLGHIFEGRKPAFVDDLTGLIIGPLFVVAEAVFALGFAPKLHAKIVERVGPTRATRPAAS